MDFQVKEAYQIIYNMVKTGRDMFPKSWDYIDFNAKLEALNAIPWIQEAVKAQISIDEAREMMSTTYEERI